ncbi:MAG: serine hydrolase domain-containing protein [Pseudomarimonas sp.]
MLAAPAVAADSLDSTAGAQAARAVRNANTAVRRVEDLAARVVDEAGVTGLSLAIVHEGAVLSERGFGVTQFGSKEAVDADTVFRLASLSKTFASALAAQLVNDGALRWDSRIADQLPALKLHDIQSAQRLTVLDILSHRVGLPYNTYDRDLEANQPYPLLVAKLGDAPATCKSGDCYAYQNIAFSLIGDMVFAVTGDFYSHQVERRLFHPLGMYSATFGRDALEASARWARPHIRSRGRWQAVRPKETYYRIPPAAGVNASARDMSQWLLAQLGDRPDVLSVDQLATMHTGQVETPGEIRGAGWRGDRVRDAHYGIGWRVFDYAGQPMVFHAGAVQGYRAMMALLPEQNFGIVLMWNCESAAPSGLLATALDEMLALPSRDWTGLERIPKRRGRR